MCVCIYMYIYEHVYVYIYRVSEAPLYPKRGTPVTQEYRATS